MDDHDRPGRLLAAFLAGDLDPAEARAWDEHLLECERCWRAVREDRDGRQAAQVLRQPAPPGLADQMTFAVEMAASAGPAGNARPGGRSRRWKGLGRRMGWQRLAGTAVALGVAVTLLVLALPGRHERGACPRRWRRWRGTRGQSCPRPGYRTLTASGGAHRWRGAAR